MSKVDTGGAAFPLPLKKEFFDAEGEHSGREELVDGDEGMTLLDHFAGLALQGILARADRGSVAAAEDAYAYAERMIAEKRKREKEK